MGEYYDLFLNCYPDIVASETHVKDVLEDERNLVLERRQQDRLIAALVLRGNVILFLGVDAEFRGLGIGTQLLAEAEELALGLGMEEIQLYGAASQIMPGAPLYPHVREFFEKRGYYQDNPNEDYQDLVLDLNSVKKCELALGEERDGLIYRWGLPEDREAAVNCAGEAQQRYEEVYWEERFYQPEAMTNMIQPTMSMGH